MIDMKTKNNLLLEKMLKDVGDRELKAKAIEIENELLKVQNEALIKQNTMMKEVMEQTGLL